METYLKRQFINGSVNTVAKITATNEIELGGGQIETHDINTASDYASALERFKNRKFVECTKAEYDEKCKQVVKEINSII